MYAVTKIPLFVCCALVLLATAGFAKSAVSLTGNELTEAINSQRVTMVLFYAPWSGNSISFLPEYDKIAQALSNDDIFVGKVDCSVDEETYKAEEIEELPALKIYISGEPIEYHRDFNVATVLDYVQRLTESSLIDIDAQHETFFQYAEKHLTPDQPIALLLVDGSDTSSATEEVRGNYDYACKKFYSVPCTVSADMSVTEMLELNLERTPLPVVVMLREFPDDEPLVSVAPKSAQLSISAMLEWMQMAAFPALTEFSEDNEASIYSLKRLGFSTHIIAIVDRHGAKGIRGHSRDITESASSDTAESAAANNALLHHAKTLANMHQGEAVFSYVDVSTLSSSPYVQDFVGRLNINVDSDVPMMLIANAVDTHVNFYSLKSIRQQDGSLSRAPVTPDQATQFVQDYFDRKLSPTSRRRHDLPDEVYTPDDPTEERRRLMDTVSDEEAAIADEEEDAWWDREADIWAGAEEEAAAIKAMEAMEEAAS